MVIYIDPPQISEYQRKLKVVDLRHTNNAEFAKVMDEFRCLISHRRQEEMSQLQKQHNMSENKRGKSSVIQGLKKLFSPGPGFYETLYSAELQHQLSDHNVLLLRTGQEVPKELLSQGVTSFLVITTDSPERNLVGLYEMKQSEPIPPPQEISDTSERSSGS